MIPMAKVTFQALLDWFVKQNATKWHIYVQAAQFDPKDYLEDMNPVSGMICLNISANATRHFTTGDESFSFWSRRQGKEIQLEIPYTAVYAAEDPTTGIPNIFPYFEDYGDVELDLPDGIEPVGVEVLDNGKHRITFNNGHVESIDEITDEELAALRADIKARELAAIDVATPESTVSVVKTDGTTVEVSIPTQAEIDALNESWRKQGMSIQCDGFKVDSEGKLVILASPIKEDTNVFKVDFGDKGNATFSGDATILNFPGKVDLKPQGEWGRMIGHDTLETKMRDRNWTVIEGGKQQPQASMPWIDTVHREKLARREALEKLAPTDKFVIANAMKSTQPELRSDGANGNSCFFPDLDVTKCTWPGKRKARPSWLKVLTGKPKQVLTQQEA